VNFKEIEVFLKVVEYKRLTDVAEQMGMTQPGVSNILKRMEREVGSPLFIRQGKSLTLSVQGKIFYESARNQWFSLQRAINNMEPGLADKREVIIATAVTSDWFIRMVGQFCEAHPDIRLVFQSERFIPEQHRLSAAEFLLLPAHRVHDEKTIPVDYQDRLYVILQKDHPLARERAVALQQLKGDDFVFVRGESGTYEQCYWDCLNSGFQPNVSLTVASRVSKFAAIRTGAWIGLVYDSAMDMAESIEDCVVLPVRGSSSGKPIVLAWYDDHLSEAGRTFLAEARRATAHREV